MRRLSALFQVVLVGCTAAQPRPAPPPTADAVAEAPPSTATDEQEAPPKGDSDAMATAPADIPVASLVVTDRHRAIVDAQDRTSDDRTMDVGRKPAELLAFLQLQSGMTVAELQAGFGYTTELLARSVGPQGRVYAQNNAFVRERFLEPHWTERLETPAFANVTRLDTELDAPFPASVRDLDLVIMVLFYHDTYWQETDRPAMNRAVFSALAPGGSYVIIDHSARRGDGEQVVRTLHRVEESLVRTEVEAVGFELTEQGAFLRNPEDPRDWDASPRAAQEAGLRGTSDRFVYRFVKPSR